MGFILVGILVAILFLWLGYMCRKKSNNTDNYIVYLLVMLALFALVFGVVTGISSHVSGYEEFEMFSTTKLIKLEDYYVPKNDDSVYYVSVSKNKSYTYSVEYYSSSKQKHKMVIFINSNNVKIIEDDKYVDAKIEKYISRAKKSFWTFGIGDYKEKYIFYIPTGTVHYNFE